MIASICVVAIHTNPLSDVDGTAGYIMSQVIPRFAVPFFFCVSGYYYESFNSGIEKRCLHTLKRIIHVYVLWSVIYFMIRLIEELQVGGTLVD